MSSNFLDYSMNIIRYLMSFNYFINFFFAASGVCAACGRCKWYPATSSLFRCKWFSCKWRKFSGKWPARIGFNFGGPYKHMNLLQVLIHATFLSSEKFRSLYLTNDRL